MTQCEKILAMLWDGPITALDALEHAGCMRLAARIADLRRAGHLITTDHVTTNTGKHIARYTLEKPNGQQSHPQYHDVSQQAAGAYGSVEVSIAQR